MKLVFLGMRIFCLLTSPCSVSGPLGFPLGKSRTSQEHNIRIHVPTFTRTHIYLWVVSPCPTGSTALCVVIFFFGVLSVLSEKCKLSCYCQAAFGESGAHMFVGQLVAVRQNV